MNFKDLLFKLNEERKASESFVRGGTVLGREKANAKAERSATSSNDDAMKKRKDAERKRQERSKLVPREKRSQGELIKEVIIVKTRSGNIQLIFKDSFNPDQHTKLNDQTLSLGDAKKVIQDPNFEQTRASKLLFGNVKEKPKSEPKEGKKEEAKPEKKERAPEGEEEKKPSKARRVSQEELMASFMNMTPEQLATVPLEMRQEYFKSQRKPPQNKEFDHVASSYEELSVKFGINPASSIPYNQQVLNALMFLAKLKAGAGQQELQTYQLQNSMAMEFTGSAFNQAKKILSQIGDECIQNLLTSMETGTKMIDSVGASDMQCGNYRFKISAGGEIALSTNSFDQSNKSFKGFLAKALSANLDKIMQDQENPKVQKFAEELKAVSDNFSQILIPKENIPMILSNEKYAKTLQQTPITDSQGNEIGTVMDENGNINPAVSYENFVSELSKLSGSATKLLKGNKQISSSISADILKIFLRGDNVVDPNMSANHIITMNGVFPISDEYINEISKTAELDIKSSKDTISVDNIDNYSSNSAGIMKNYSTVVEALQPKIKQPSLQELLINKNQIDPFQILSSIIVKKNDFNFNASLLPGFKPKDLNTVEYNYVTIGKKTVKIPVITSDQTSIKQLMVAEAYEVANDLIIESLVNNFVLSSLIRSRVINEVEAQVLYDGPVSLYESSESTMVNLNTILENIMFRLLEDPEKVLDLQHELNQINEAYVRDYKKEYKNYHGKSKQRKERAARTRARELMKKKGRVRKGDGKDIDHKKPLRSGGSNGINNLRVRDKSENRSDNGHSEGETQKKDWE